MDLSKLPKLSQDSSAPPPAPLETPPPVVPLDYRPRASAGVGADIWFSVIIGLLMLYMGSNFGRFVAAKISGQTYHTNVNWTTGSLDGTEVSYFDLQGFTAWTDMAVFLFGIVLFFDAATKAFGGARPSGFKRLLLMLATTLTLITVLLNLYVCIRLVEISVLPLISGLAVAFGGWILADEWRMLRQR